MSPVEALTAATSRAAQVCGLGDRKGRLVPGYDADLLAVDGDPLPSLRRYGGCGRCSCEACGCGEGPVEPRRRGAARAVHRLRTPHNLTQRAEWPDQPGPAIHFSTVSAIAISCTASAIVGKPSMRNHVS